MFCWRTSFVFKKFLERICREKSLKKNQRFQFIFSEGKRCENRPEVFLNLFLILTSNCKNVDCFPSFPGFPGFHNIYFTSRKD